jgi:very-short-patch-repair endonuclease
MSGRTHPLDHVTGLRELARRQLGVVRRDQLAALGVSSDHVRSQVRAERWRVIGPFVVVLSTGALTRAQQRAVAALHAGPGARLAGRTALEQLGLRSWETDLLHVSVPRGCRVRPLPGVVAHTRVALGRSSPAAEPDPRAASGHAGGAGERRRTHDEAIDAWPPTDSAATAAVDAASWERSAASATSLVIAVVQQRLATAAEILEELDRRPRVRHVRALRAALGEADAGAHSRAELDVAVLVRRAGLGAPRRQVAIETALGRLQVDLLVALPDGRRLVIEVDGPHHDDPRVRASDQERDAALIALGYVVLRIPIALLRADPERVLAQLRAFAAAAA